MIINYIKRNQIKLICDSKYILKIKMYDKTPFFCDFIQKFDELDIRSTHSQASIFAAANTHTLFYRC